MRTVAKVLKVSRSNLQEQLKPSQKKRLAHYNKDDDEFYLGYIRGILQFRPSMGYRRMTVHLNRRLESERLKAVNHKRIYRIMKRNGLTLQKYSGKISRTHQGKIITLHSNTRWCSDAFAVQCYNGDRLHVAFAMDTCDREILGYVASTQGMAGKSIRDLMVESVEYRFKNSKLPHSIQWLSDNGPCYIAHETVSFGRALGFEICTTPSYSPESNGMAEAFVKRFKQDYVYFGKLTSAKTLMEQLPAWFEDYNNFAVHKGLGMKSPREFLQLNQAS